MSNDLLTISIAGLETQPTRLDNYFDFLSSDDIRVKGTRVGIESILHRYIYSAETPEEIVTHFYTVTLEQVYATILYYLHHKEAVGKYVADWLALGQRMREEQRINPSPTVQRLMKLKAEREAAQQENGASLSHG
ncbi:MAG: DUF433 domain-containing protein [Tildeniella nuda ZEHNDER 1965/U140]|nr:DUF433 domain-containing protein [Tildeniella nuda ZEHNDER 1965/U140]